MKVVVATLLLCYVSGVLCSDYQKLAQQGYVFLDGASVIPFTNPDGQTVYAVQSRALATNTGATGLHFGQAGGATGRSFGQAGGATRVHFGGARAGGFRQAGGAARGAFVLHGSASGRLAGTGARRGGAGFRTVSVSQRVPSTGQVRFVPPTPTRGLFRTGYGDEFDLHSFGTIGTGSFGVPSFSGQYVDVGQFDFATAKDTAFENAPETSRVQIGNLDQRPVGKRYKTGFARQYETSSADKTGTGNGEATVEVTADREAEQTVEQTFKQTGAGEGKVDEGSTYEYQTNDDIPFQPVAVETVPLHAGPADAVPAAAQPAARTGYTR